MNDTSAEVAKIVVDHCRSMTPAEWWMLYEEHAAMHRDPNQPAPLTEDDVIELRELMEAERARDG